MLCCSNLLTNSSSRAQEKVLDLLEVNEVAEFALWSEGHRGAAPTT